MYLYKNNKDKSINVYNFFPNRSGLIEFKKKYLEDIKSVILHINNAVTEVEIFTKPTILFSVLNRKEKDGKITYIEDTNNDETISKYINGYFDSLAPTIIIGDRSMHQNPYSETIDNQDSALLFEGGSPGYNGYITDEGILLTGWLYLFQPLLGDNICNIDYPYYLDFTDDEVVEFLKIFNCLKLRTISLDDLRFLRDEGLINFSDDFDVAFENSKIVLDSYKRIKRKINKKTIKY